MCAGASLRCSSRLTARNKAQSELHTLAAVDARSILKHVDLEENESGKERLRKNKHAQTPADTVLRVSRSTAYQCNTVIRRFQAVDVGAQKSGDLLQAQEWRLGT